MTNYTAKMMNTAIGALGAHQAVMATTGNNIANAQTAGYVRKRLDLEARVSRGNSTGINIGSGVQAGAILRVVDEFANKIMRTTTAEKASTQVVNEYLDRVQQLFSLSEDRQTIGSTLDDFYSSLNDLALNPASIELRSNVLTAAEDLVNTIKNTYNEVAGLQTEMDSRLKGEVSAVNTLTKQIAELNVAITSTEGTGNVAGDERDKRDLLLQKLSEKIGVSVVEVSDGSVSVYLSGGLSLVSGGNSRELEVTTAPSFAGVTSPPSLSGGLLNYVVYNYGTDASPAHVDLTSDLSETDGVIGGLLQTRGVQDAADTSAFQADGFLPDLASRIEAITRTLLTTFNEIYRGPDENTTTGAFVDASSGDLNGNTPGVYGFFDFEYGGVKDNDSGGADGIPDDLGNHNIDSYSRFLTLAISDPREIAAARDLNTANGATTFVAGDNSNITALVALQQQVITFATGTTYAQDGTWEEIYNQTVAFVANSKTQAETNFNVAEARALAAENRRDSFSAVSLDEEFSTLIKSQKAYEASARLISTAVEMLNTIMGIGT